MCHGHSQLQVRIQLDAVSARFVLLVDPELTLDVGHHWDGVVHLQGHSRGGRDPNLLLVQLARHGAVDIWS